MILNLTRGNSSLRVPLHLPATPAEIGEAYAKLDTIKPDDRQTHIAGATTGVGTLDRWLFRKKPDLTKLGDLAEKLDEPRDNVEAVYRSGDHAHQHIHRVLFVRFEDGLGLYNYRAVRFYDLSNLLIAENVSEWLQ